MNKTTESIFSSKLGSWDLCQIANIVLNNSKSPIPSLFSDPYDLFPASDKAKLFGKNFSKGSNFDDSGIPLAPLFSITNLHNISVTPKMVKKVIMTFDLSKASGLLLYSSGGSEEHTS